MKKMVVDITDTEIEQAVEKIKEGRKVLNKKFLTAPVVARLLGVDNKTIHNWVNKGRIASWRTPGGHLRFTYEAVEQFMSDHEVPADLASFIQAVANLAPAIQIVVKSFTTRTVADKLGISVTTVHSLVKQGKLQPCFKSPGRHLRFSPAKIYELADSLKVGKQ